MPNTFLPSKGNYRDLIAFQKAECIHDITYYFCHKFLSKGDRTIDQMVQSARSGKQNIVEASAASATSSETEIKLMNVARASLHELLVDYEDYLRVRGLEQWSADSPKAAQARRACMATTILPTIAKPSKNAPMKPLPTSLSPCSIRKMYSFENCSTAYKAIL